jgi:cysteine desulfurase
MAPRPIYFDYAATTPLDPRALSAMLPYLGDAFGNPDSRSHPFGWEAEEAVAVARERVAVLLGATPEEIVFTSGATESLNLALKGLLRGCGRQHAHLVTTTIEHAAGREVARALAREGFGVTAIPPGSGGHIDPASVQAAIRPETVLVSVIHGNNEIGTLSNLEAIGAACARHGVLLHADATQSFGKVPLDPGRAGVHLLSCSSHKICGPKGAGALYVRRQSPRLPVQPLAEGGGQERGLRPGTLNVPAIVGFGEACRIAANEMPEESLRVAGLRDRLESALRAGLDGVIVHGAQPRLPGISNLRFEGVTAEAILLGLRRVALSAGSACASGSLEPSPVLLSLGLDPLQARGAIRFSLGRFTTVAEVDTVIRELTELVARLRAAGPESARPNGPGGKGP